MRGSGEDKDRDREGRMGRDGTATTTQGGTTRH